MLVKVIVMYLIKCRENLNEVMLMIKEMTDNE